MPLVVRLWQRFAFVVLVPLAARLAAPAGASEPGRGVVITAEGLAATPGAPALRRAPAEAIGRPQAQPLMMRRSTGWPVTGHAVSFETRSARVLVHVHSFTSLADGQHNASSGNFSNESNGTAGEATSTGHAAANATRADASTSAGGPPASNSTTASANSTTPSRANASTPAEGSPASNSTTARDVDDTERVDDEFTNNSASSHHVAGTNSTAKGNQTANMENSNATSGPSSPSPLSGPFVLGHVPVTHMHHQIAAIAPGQWPPDFCVDLKMDAPMGHTPELRRCIVLLGGSTNSSCGMFNIYINDINEVGMGEMCKNDASFADGPLLNDDGGLESNTTHALRFCYDTRTGDANIWKEGKLMVSGVRRWNFTRSGFVSVFVGSHAVKSFAEGLFGEDRATLYGLSVEDNSPTTSTTTTVTSTTTAAATTFIFTAPPTTTPLEEVDVNDTEATPEEADIVAKIIGEMRRTATTTPKPKWNRTHHFEQGNVTVTQDNKTVVTHDVRTVVTSSETASTQSRSHVFRMPGAPPANGTARNVTIYINGSAVHTAQTA